MAVQKPPLGRVRPYEEDKKAVSDLISDQIDIIKSYFSISRNAVGELIQDTATRRIRSLNDAFAELSQLSAYNNTIGDVAGEGTKLLLRELLSLGRDTADILTRSVILSHRMLYRAVGEEAWLIRNYVRQGTGFSPLTESVHEAMTRPEPINYMGSVVVELRLPGHGLLAGEDTQIWLSPETTYVICVQFIADSTSTLDGVKVPLSVSGGEDKQSVPFLLFVDFNMIDVVPAERFIEVPRSGVSAIEYFNFRTPPLDLEQRLEIGYMTVSVYQHEMLYAISRLPVAGVEISRRAGPTSTPGPSTSSGL